MPKRTLPQPRVRPQKRELRTHLDYYRQMDMITEEEFEALLKGKAALSKGGVLTHLNMNHGHDGVEFRLFFGRASMIRANKLLDLDPYDLP